MLSEGDHSEQSERILALPYQKIQLVEPCHCPYLGPHKDNEEFEDMLFKT